MLRRLRILALLMILVAVAVGTWLDRIQSTDWDGPLLVALYPVNIDGSTAAAGEISNPKTANTELLTAFFADEATQHGVRQERPLRFVLAPAIPEAPPLLPAGAGVLGTMAWSLKLRWWNLWVDDPPGPTPTIRLFLLFHDPKSSPRVPHSAGLQKGLLGIAHLFAAPHMAGSNRVVIAHELLHTFGFDAFGFGHFFNRIHCCLRLFGPLGFNAFNVDICHCERAFKVSLNIAGNDLHSHQFSIELGCQIDRTFHCFLR